ncbi:hypothetical protein BC830DRAFT_205543 [Chytriomyces sp. MP71]|nr:hypothetical protein BC830DRAFT_205543 [Chytriomyces sp. MP71]
MTCFTSQDPIIDFMLHRRPEMHDVPADADEERRRRMFVMLRWSSQYKRLQVEQANAKWQAEQDSPPDNPFQMLLQKSASDLACDDVPSATQRHVENQTLLHSSECSGLKLEDLQKMDCELALEQTRGSTLSDELSWAKKPCIKPGADPKQSDPARLSEEVTSGNPGSRRKSVTFAAEAVSLPAAEAHESLSQNSTIYAHVSSYHD